MKELLKGTMDYTMLLAIFASSTLIAGGLLFFLCEMVQPRERALPGVTPLGQAPGT